MILHDVFRYLQILVYMYSSINSSSLVSCQSWRCPTENPALCCRALRRWRQQKLAPMPCWSFCQFTCSAQMQSLRVGKNNVAICCNRLNRNHHYRFPVASLLTVCLPDVCGLPLANWCLLWNEIPSWGLFFPFWRQFSVHISKPFGERINKLLVGPWSVNVYGWNSEKLPAVRR